MDSISALTAHFVAPQHKFLVSVAACINKLLNPENSLEKFAEIQREVVNSNIAASSVIDFSSPTRISPGKPFTLPVPVVPSATTYGAACSSISTPAISISELLLSLVPFILIGFYLVLRICYSGKAIKNQLKSESSPESSKQLVLFKRHDPYPEFTVNERFLKPTLPEYYQPYQCTQRITPFVLNLSQPRFASVGAVVTLAKKQTITPLPLLNEARVVSRLRNISHYSEFTINENFLKPTLQEYYQPSHYTQKITPFVVNLSQFGLPSVGAVVTLVKKPLITPLRDEAGVVSRLRNISRYSEFTINEHFLKPTLQEYYQPSQYTQKITPFVLNLSQSRLPSVGAVVTLSKKQFITPLPLRNETRAIPTLRNLAQLFTTSLSVAYESKLLRESPQLSIVHESPQLSTTSKVSTTSSLADHRIKLKDSPLQPSRSKLTTNKPASSATVDSTFGGMPNSSEKMKSTESLSGIIKRFNKSTLTYRNPRHYSLSVTKHHRLPCRSNLDPVLTSEIDSNFESMLNSFEKLAITEPVDSKINHSLPSSGIKRRKRKTSKIDSAFEIMIHLFDKLEITEKLDPIIKPINESINESTNKPTKKSAKKSAKKSTKKSTKKSITKSQKSQPIVEPICNSPQNSNPSDGSPKKPRKVKPASNSNDNTIINETIPKRSRKVKRSHNSDFNDMINEFKKITIES